MCENASRWTRFPPTISSQRSNFKFDQRGCKLDPTLISMLVEIWRPGTHTFHLPCGGFTITLEDIALQLGLLKDGRAITGPVIILGKEDLCDALLENVLNKYQAGQIEIKLVGRTIHLSIYPEVNRGPSNT
ncbi:hypothetical protein PVK06_024354 [Gossypium arboreum]|uniref:Aminotransferase-like plant mobile domain-containing protein n=1 Tax=Gossypium arboreum TaxID=29729 RepID=A0ABR0PDM2_GOSAR|nr:hypothetical protein PVK06_024354 [Gossypium arboreum]